MKTPWKNIDAAFAPMYDESVVISGNRPNDVTFKQTLQVAFFVYCSGDPLSEDMMDTDRQDIHLCCRDKDFAFIQTLKRGDMIERKIHKGERYRIQDVKHDSYMGWVISARGV